MNSFCSSIHELMNQKARYDFSFNEKYIPKNGIYILFEKNEFSHSVNRIVRVGTHTGENQLLSRIKQHFINKNKDRSIFRKNIGRAILNKEEDPFIKDWDIDLTTNKNRILFKDEIDLEYQNKVEDRVSQYMKTNFSFCFFEVKNKEDRLKLESRIISTVSLCNECKGSEDWLGNYSPKEKIRNSGLWLVNELYKKPLSKREFERLSSLIKNGY